jgi:sec-independent protein translocase protein TatA
MSGSGESALADCLGASQDAIMMSIDTNAIQVLGLFGLPGGWEVVVILAVILLLFGGKKLPEMARGLARGMRVFRDELKGIKTDLESDEPAPKNDQPVKKDQDAPRQDGDAGKEA